MQVIAEIVFPFTHSIQEMLVIIVNVPNAFNAAVKDVFGWRNYAKFIEKCEQIGVRSNEWCEKSHS